MMLIPCGEDTDTQFKKGAPSELGGDSIVRTLPGVRVHSGKVRRNETVTLRPADEGMIRQALNVDAQGLEAEGEQLLCEPLRRGRRR
jgi:hypothetical protein